ncbi:MAG: Gfo/Idh/MocA family oxidoreductase [Acidobacteria bacterium]|nr:Gfo/Idh/MocA family oxidoreductase [Acidobacteriota bacterium]MCI0718730.1 Gfo/Idh/MocA family oxidoreductase [Acidobacteriota bacterium]
MSNPVRIGVVGAGANTRRRHIPNLKAQAGVEIVSVCNRSRESAEKAAKEFGIPKVHRHWKELVESNEIDAVVIGTWPYLHCPVTLAALGAGKHVLTEARMAMNAAEARLMLEASRRKPHLVTQVVPSPYTLKIDRTVQKLLAEGFLGDLQALEVRASLPGFLDREGPLQWRHDRDLSGLNVLGMGIWYEAVLRWVGEAKMVLAMSRVAVKQRKDSLGLMRTISVPDHVDILAEMACGAQARFQFSAVTGLAPGPEAWLFGSDGTLRYDASSEKLLGVRRGETVLHEISIPEKLAIGWRVEEEFINAIRAQEKVKLTTFEDGLKYMQFTEAVSRSASLSAAVAVQQM